MKWRLMLCIALLVGVVYAEPEKKAGSTKVTSNRLDFDYKRMVAVFTGDVVVLDPEVKITTDKLTMAFGDDESVKLVTCRGKVKIWYEDKIASAKQAIYQAEKGEIELLGDAVLQRSGDTVKGDRIVFNLHNETMICEPGFLVVTPGENEDTGLERMKPGATKRK